MKKKSLFRGSGDIFLFRENSLMIAAAVVSLMLQIISFFTTLDGAKAYFEATFAFAPQSRRSACALLKTPPQRL